MALAPRLKARVLAFLTSRRLPNADATGIHRAVLYTVYGGDIAHPERDGPRGTLVVALRGRKPAFVRCAFADNGGTLLCEAVPGAYPPNPDTPPPAIPTAMEEGMIFGASPESKIDTIAPLAPERDEAAIRRMMAGQS